MISIFLQSALLDLNQGFLSASRVSGGRSHRTELRAENNGRPGIRTLMAAFAAAQFSKLARRTVSGDLPYSAS